MENQLNDKNKLLIRIIVCIVIMLVIALVCVLVFYKEDKDTKYDNSGVTPTPTPVVTPTPTSVVTPTPTPVPTKAAIGKNESGLSDAEVIKIAKAKLDAVVKFSRDHGDGENEDELDGTGFFYYGTVDTFKKKFYSIYSKQLVYNDVLVEYKDAHDYENWTSNVDIKGDMLSGMPSYILKNNKVYRDSCAIGSCDHLKFDKFVVLSGTSDTLKLSYVDIGKDPDDPNAKEYERDNAEMILVKEDGEWKIKKATILDQCNCAYEIGK